MVLARSQLAPLPLCTQEEQLVLSLGDLQEIQSSWPLSLLRSLLMEISRPGLDILKSQRKHLARVKQPAIQRDLPLSSLTENLGPSGRLCPFPAGSCAGILFINSEKGFWTAIPCNSSLRQGRFNSMVDGQKALSQCALRRGLS